MSLSRAPGIKPAVTWAKMPRLHKALLDPNQSSRFHGVAYFQAKDMETPPMNDKMVLTEAEEERLRPSSLLSTFEEIARTFLSLVSGERGNGKDFISLQDYLDSSVLINGAYCRRRTVLLAIHDMKDEREAPPALQSKTLSKLELLHLRPVPQVIFYDDIATAILRMEVVIRLEAMQAPVESKLGLNQSAPGAAGRLAPALGQTPSFGSVRKAPRHIPN